MMEFQAILRNRSYTDITIRHEQSLTKCITEHLGKSGPATVASISAYVADQCSGPHPQWMIAATLNKLIRQREIRVSDTLDAFETVPADHNDAI